MRVVEQLIEHLQAVGRLSDTEIDRLGLLGYGPKCAAAAADVTPEWDPDDYAEPTIPPAENTGSRWHRLIQTHPRLPYRRGKRRPRLPPGLSHTDLRGALGDARTSTVFAVFAKVAEQLDPSANSLAAPRAIHRATSEQLDGAVAVCLDRQLATLADFRACTVSDAHTVPSLARRGPVANAFDALIRTASEDRQPTKYAWLLRDAEVAWAVDVTRAQRAFAGTFDRITQVAQGRVGRWLQGCRDEPIAYWALVILFSSAHDRVTDVDLHRRSGLHEPRRPPSSLAEAWHCAATINPLAVLPYMDWFLRERPDSEARPLLVCPPGWDGP